MSKSKLFVVQRSDEKSLEISPIDFSEISVEDFVSIDSAEMELDRSYSRLREQVNAENSLYTQRIYWLIFIQAFLFATSGLILQAFNSPNKEIENVMLLTFLLIISFVGCYVGIVSHNIINGARKTLREIGAIWVEIASSYPDKDHLKNYPDVRGGKLDLSKPMGQERNKIIFRSGSLGILFSAVWFVFGVIAIWLL